MSERLLAEVTAEYVWKNRENGWLKYALRVLAAEPYLRSKLIGRLCRKVRQTIQKRLPGHNVEVGEANVWFSVDVTRETWGDLGVCLGNWKVDASQVVISIYNWGSHLPNAATAEIKECLAERWQPRHSKREPRYVWYIRPERSSWRDPEFLLRVAEDTEVVVGEVAKDVVEVVELVDDVLTRVARSVSDQSD